MVEIVFTDGFGWGLINRDDNIMRYIGGNEKMIIVDAKTGYEGLHEEISNRLKIN